MALLFKMAAINTKTAITQANNRSKFSGRKALSITQLSVCLATSKMEYLLN